MNKNKRPRRYIHRDICLCQKDSFREDCQDSIDRLMAHMYVRTASRRKKLLNLDKH